MFGPFPFSLLSRLYLRLVNAVWRLKIGRIGPESRLFPGVVIYFPEKLEIGARTQIGNCVQIWAGGGLTIGDDVLIASHCVLTTQSHDIGAARRGLTFQQTQTAAPIHIGSNVWIGAGAIILPGVTIGRNAVVGAGSVVTGSVPPDTLVVGAPARAVRTLGKAEE